MIQHTYIATIGHVQESDLRCPVCGLFHHSKDGMACSKCGNALVNIMSRSGKRTTQTEVRVYPLQDKASKELDEQFNDNQEKSIFPIAAVRFVMYSTQKEDGSLRFPGVNQYITVGRTVLINARRHYPRVKVFNRSAAKGGGQAIELLYRVLCNVRDFLELLPEGKQANAATSTVTAGPLPADTVVTTTTTGAPVTAAAPVIAAGGAPDPLGPQIGPNPGDLPPEDMFTPVDDVDIPF